MNRVLAHLGSKYPIVQAPMGWIARSQLASAVSNAGGMGIIETSSGEAEAVAVEVEKMRDLTDAPFGMNLPLLFLKNERMLEIVLESGVKFVTTSAGSPAKLLDKLKSKGMIVYHAVPTVAAAMKAVEAGVDGLVVEGAEGGGFKNPEEVALPVLLQAIRDKTDIPMIAAGGIADGRGMAMAFACGAEGIQIGTRMVSSLESPVHQNYKQAIIDSDETGTVVLNKKASPCVRALKTNTSMAYAESGFMDRSALGSVTNLYFGGDMESSVGLAGQTAGLIDSVRPVEDILTDMVAEFHSICGRMGALAASQGF